MHDFKFFVPIQIPFELQSDDSQIVPVTEFSVFREGRELIQLTLFTSFSRISQENRLSSEMKIFVILALILSLLSVPTMARTRYSHKLAGGSPSLHSSSGTFRKASFDK
ncbi:hypothetical protein GCK72_013960 [Caenorhabditis remanei]|uniref:Uncharacterized protein n=1 Tax=Caenorhabditis remanei TaxID=31234 RepID=A0A6A5GS69_CAERE|nr:hypothetical protein GCK72_013960 [Caenorhabditis remanei]KAF1757504.1 hypothetical protein GCK72_013960 [Caenorhabditis remanei]